MIEIKSALHGNGVQKVIAKIFVECFFEQYLFNFSNDKERLKKAFEGAFCENTYYLAYLDGITVGILACTSNHNRSIKLDKKNMWKHLGLIRGIIAYYVLNKEWNEPRNYGDTVGYISCVATSSEVRGQGIAQSLLTYAIESFSYSQFILEVFDTNKNAIKLYESIGFNEFQRMAEKNPKQTGCNERISMKYIV